MQIFIGIVLGIALALLAPEAARAAMLLGELFVQALKAVAPVLVLVLVASAIANRGASHMGQMRPILLMYLVGTVLAALLAVLLSVLFPTSLNLVVGQLDATAPQGISEVLRALLEKLVDNPLNAMLTGNYIGIVVWGVLLGIFLHSAADTTRRALGDLSDAVTAIVRIVIRLAPIGIFGLVAGNLAVAGLGVLEDYARILTVLLSAMLIMALVVNPFIAWVAMRRNPYPLVFTALRVSGLTAFFTRSSAANIPVNLALCERLNLERDTYAVSIPLGATINMGGAAITITVLTLAATHTLGINVDLATALLLSVVAALSACGASGVAGGSLLLIPLSCGLFGISDDVAMQVVAVGFMISILQDSAETALNSSTDVVFTAAVASPGKLNVRRPLILLLLALIAGAIAGSLVTRWYQTRDVPVAPSKLVRDLVTNPAMPEAVVEEHRKDNFSTLGSVPEIMQLPGAFTRSEALHVLAGRADGAAVQGHIFAAARIVDDVEREQALGILFARLAEIDPASALALARTEHFDALRSIESTVWSTWARKDLDAALFAAKTQTTSVNQNVAAQALYAAFGFMGNDITDRIETELGIGPDRSQRANYLYRIADSSPAKAIDYIDAMPPGREKSWNVNWLAYYLALRDPEEAQAFAARFESPAERQQFSDVLAAEAARANPRLVIDRLLAAGSAGNTTEFHSAIQALAETDPETADAYFRSARNSQMRQMIGFGIVGALAGTDPAAAIAWARENDRGGNDNFEMIALMALARHDPQRALVEAQNGTNPGMRESLVSNVVGVVAADDPRKALLMSQSLEDPRLRESSELHVAQAWLAQDPDAALAWLDTLDEAKARAIIDNSGWSLLHSDVDAAMRLLPRVSDDKQHMWRSQIAAQLSQTRSPDEALAFIRQFEGDANYPQLQAEVVGSIAVTDVARARQLADQLGELGSRDSAYLQIAAQQAAASPADAMLTAQQIADVNIRAEATAAAITQAGRQDPAVASRMVAQLQPGPARDLAIVQVMSDWSNLESMEGLIDTIEDPDLRSQAKMNRLYYAAENDPARARALLADPEIPAEMREEFQSMLENGGVRID